MNNKLACGLSFVAGLAAGAGITVVLAKQRYEEKMKDEVKAARDTYNKMAKELADKNEKAKEELKKNLGSNDEEIFSNQKEEIKDISEDANEEQVELDLDYASKEKDVIELTEIIPKSSAKRPIIISQEEFGDAYDDDYSAVTLYYYEDGVLSDDAGEIIEDPDSVVGLDNLYALNESNDYTMYIRNDIRRSFYEVLLDERKYYDIYK